MMMNDTVARIVEIMFQDVEMNEEVAAIRDEVMNNCQERYTDLVSSGMNEDDAIAAVIESLKGMEEVLTPYKHKAQHVVPDGDEEDHEQNLTFTAQQVHTIDLHLISDDVFIEASCDDDYHVLWNSDDKSLIQASLHHGVLKIERSAGQEPFEPHAQNEATPEGERRKNAGNDGYWVEINADSVSDLFKSIGNSLKNLFAKGSLHFGGGGLRVTVQIPQSAVPHVKLLTTSGDIHVNDVALTDLDITSTSGDINISLDEDQHMARIDLRTTSGDMEISAFADRMNITSTSGDVEVEGRVNDLTVSTVSGDIDVRSDVVNMTFKAVSGDVDLAFDSDEIREVRGSTISGDIDIDLPEGVGVIAISTQTRSGDVTTRHHTNGIGPMVNGSVSSMSGDIAIR